MHKPAYGKDSAHSRGASGFPESITSQSKMKSKWIEIPLAWSRLGMKGQVPRKRCHQPDPLWLLCCACSVPCFSWVGLCPWMGIREFCPPQGGKNTPLGSHFLHSGLSGHEQKGKSCCILQPQRTKRVRTQTVGVSLSATIYTSTWVCIHSPETEHQ